MREESYEEVLQDRATLKSQLSSISELVHGLCSQLDDVVQELPDELHESAVALQTALVELIDGDEEELSINESVAGDNDSTNVDKPANESRRIKEGGQLREHLKQVVSLNAKNKTKEAQQKLATVPQGRAGKSVPKERARELAQLSFTFGGMDVTAEAVARFTNMPEVKLLIAKGKEKLRITGDTAKVEKDLETAKQLLATARGFFTEIMATDGRGRRDDDDMNAFWAGCAALLPADLFQSKRGRSAMRILGLSYRQARRGAQIRKELEDRGRGWKRIQTSPV